MYIYIDIHIYIYVSPLKFPGQKLGLGASTKRICHTICFSPMVQAFVAKGALVDLGVKSHLLFVEG